MTKNFSDGVKYQVTENIDKYKLASEGIYLNKLNKKKNVPHIAQSRGITSVSQIWS